MPWARRRTYSPFVRKQRKAARIALYGSLIIMAVATTAGGFYLRRPLLGEQGWMREKWAERPEVDLLRRFVRIDTTKDTGSEVAAVRFLAAELEKSGIRSTVEELPGGKANLWAIVNGADPKAIVLHQHVDTDPVPDPSVWKHSPWSADIEGPWLWGRGVFDMKSVGVAQIVALQRLVASRKPLKRSIMVLVTSSEEHGSDFGMRWILLAHPELVERFGVFLTEGGAVEARSPEDIKYWGTETAQRRYVIVTFCSADRQRLEDLRADLHSIDHRPRMTDAVRHFFDAYSPYRDAAQIRALLADRDRIVEDSAVFAALPAYLRSKLIHQAYPQVVKEAPGGGYSLEVRLLILPGASFEEARAELLPEWMVFGLESIVQEPSAPTDGSPVDDPDFLAIDAILRRRFPGAAIGPWLPVGSITDARFVRPLGVPSYGFSPFPVLSTDTMYIGRPNERIDLPGYVQGVDLYAEILARLAT